LPSIPEQDLGSQEAREKRIEKKLKKLGANIVDTQVSALVNGGEATHRRGCRRNIQADRSQHIAKPLQSPTQITNKEIVAGDVFSTGRYE
jgi:hypothetical protein